MATAESFSQIRTPLLILICIVWFTELRADSPCGTFVVKVIYFTNSDRLDSGYIYFNRFQDGVMLFNFIDEYNTVNTRIPPGQIEFDKIKGFDTAYYHKILAVNRSVMKDTSVSKENNGYIYLEKLPVTDRICDFNYLDTINYTCFSINMEDEEGYRLDSMVDYQSHVIHYGYGASLNLDSIKLIVLDTILWCGDIDQLQFLNLGQVEQIRRNYPYTYFQLNDSYAQQYWIDFFCFDPKWSRYRILSSLDLERMDHAFLKNGGVNIINDFPPKLRKAIKSGKVMYFLRWCP